MGMHLRYFATMLASLLLLTACGSSGGGGSEGADSAKQAKAEVKWPFAQDAILIELSTDVDLNFYANRSHTLVFAALQFPDEKAFVKLLTKPEGLAKSMQSGNLPEGALHMDRYVISPDVRELLTLNRVQDAQFIGILAGYYAFEPERSARLFRIPLNMDSSGVIFKEYKAEPAQLALRVALGPQSIANAQSLTHDPDAKVKTQEVPLNNDNLEIKLSPETLKKSAEQASALIKL